MSSKISVERTMDDVAAIRTVLPRHTVKMLAALMGVPLSTAHEWIYRHFSPARRREVALALLKKWDEEDRQRAACRLFLEKMAQSNEVVGLVGDRDSASKNRSA